MPPRLKKTISMQILSKEKLTRERKPILRTGKASSSICNLTQLKSKELRYVHLTNYESMAIESAHERNCEIQYKYCKRLQGEIRCNQGAPSTGPCKGQH